MEEKKKERGEIIGKKIRAIRESKGMTRGELCDLLGGIYSYHALTKLERGKLKDPPITVITKIAEVLNVPVEELLSEDEKFIFYDDLLKDPDVTLLMYNTKDLSAKDKRILLRILMLLKEESKRKKEGSQNT
jgi:transcriptional regulator with XRE-family HTH domain